MREYFYLGNQLVAAQGCLSSSAPPCNEREWYHTDTLGSVLARTNAGGAVVARIDYEPWGEELSHSGAMGDRQYNGRVYDPGTGFHDYGARMYWPQIGRFVSPDPAGIHPENPQSWNRYAYVWNNPYKYVDPSVKEVDLQWHSVTKESFHTSIRITPENQDAYRNDSRFKEVDGKLTMTLGAGPDLAMRLKNAPNREKDATPHPDTHSQIAVPPQYKSDDQFISALLSLDSAYKGDASYFFFPGRESYNSNSYVSGLLNAAGAQVAPPPVSAPGWDRPLPASYFGVQKADDSAWRPAPSK
ncbi:hypothetical protein AnaeK_3077 [Anaeromyxobacter sp. K]|uniref:RHS repeat domain-containing protein n=1 Tax=Anaeromyxobacter sp. (strain K) TaxID=447217 RepID=UPI00015F890D|nr:RHS repeat-associated core domain-containing protein [Anaeromyxobacter sp. K]ACG74298.1 hypothetical protein AnaeK_3077 [Anaeromyxobacter sp. K]